MSERTDAERDEIIRLKRQLALSYAENAALRGNDQPFNGGDIQAPSIMTQQRPDIQQEFEGIKDTIVIGRQALDLERMGYPYSIALKIAEAVHNGDYEAAAKYQQMHENNERAAHAAEIEEKQDAAKLRRWFGLE